MELQMRVTIDFQVLCIISAILGFIIIILASLYITEEVDRVNTDCLAMNPAEVKYCRYNYFLPILAGFLAVILGLCQLVFALVLLLSNNFGNSKNYFICHLAWGLVALLVFAVLCIIIVNTHNYCFREEEAFFTFIILDMIFCFITALVLVTCGEKLGCGKGENLQLDKGRRGQRSPNKSAQGSQAAEPIKKTRTPSTTKAGKKKKKKGKSKRGKKSKPKKLATGAGFSFAK
ncbi:unnamed protein product [Allacma fusca]|uniref:Uncharacterized protein n=1 Tax=Allacma fusca TaxID=39272 RepID=A0A8J2PQK8_9HEXA|nr:unnamed protein product [Allacma fusca]